MIKKLLTTLSLLLCAAIASGQSPRHEFLLEKGWKFTREDGNFSGINHDDSTWEDVTVPHDWAIYGPFDAGNDAQVVAITQNFETEASLKTGRTGGLPYTGTGWYRIRFDIPDYTPGKTAEILFDGAMSRSQVYINGQFVGYRPYGYVSFHYDITPYLNPDGKDNVLAVRLDNLSESSRWYPGAGLYRNVHVIVTDRVHVPVWGTQISTPEVSRDKALVDIKVTVSGADRISTDIRTADGSIVASSGDSEKTSYGFNQEITVEDPELWSPESPALYYAVTSVYKDGRKVDEYESRFGIRTIELIPDKGFFLNGEHRKFQGVCNHHDLGPLGAAVNVAALRRQLTMLKEMGCDAIRTSHNMPAPELVQLCDEMGFMMMIEPFDEWDIAKCRNGYHLYFSEWAERDMVNMLHQYRNCPSVVFWSIGNEVPSQCDPSGYMTAKFLSDICRREDPTRFITCGMDQVLCVLKNGLATLLDVPGFNYRVHLYQEAYDTLPQKLVLGSETASTISSRGVYKFPVEMTSKVRHEDLQCSSYDVEYCGWSNLPDLDFAMADDKPWEIGQFVWTGFDYLGEPTPYNVMPNHSSNFGIIDLASIPKDRYWLYRSVWRPEEETLHILPHWTWPGREGEITPVFVYTNYPSAELFVNGRSQGVRTKAGSSAQAGNSGKAGDADQSGNSGKSEGTGKAGGTDQAGSSGKAGDTDQSGSSDKAGNTDLTRYRLMWNEVRYEPGEIRVVAYDKDGKPAAERTVRTAGEPARLELTVDRKEIASDGKDLAYIEVSIVDKDGNPCPTDGRLVKFSTEGAAGTYRASANGDPTCLDLFHLPQMHLFSGKLTAIVQSSGTPGEFSFTASADGVESATITINAR